MKPRPLFTATRGDYTAEVFDSPHLPARRTPSRGYHLFTRAVTTLLLGLMLVATALLATPAPAKAGWIDDAVRSAICSSVYFNRDADVPSGLPNTTNGMPKESEGAHAGVKGYNITAYEKYGTSGLGWTVWVGPDEAGEMKDEGEMGGRQLVALAGGKDSLNAWAKMRDKPRDQATFFNADQSCGDWLNMGWTTGANMIMALNGSIVWLTGFVFQVATETASSVIHDLDETIEEVVKTLTGALYFELFEVMVVLAALWMGYVGLIKRRSTEMAQDALWMFGAAFLGGLMLANPMAVSNAVNGTVATVSQSTMTTIASAGVGPLSEGNSLCEVNNAGNSFAPEGEEKPNAATRGTARTVQCSLWSSFLYTPWVMGQFGHAAGDAAENGQNYVNPSGEQPGDYGHLAKQTPVLDDADIPSKIRLGDREVDSNWALLQLDSRVSYPGSDTKTQGKQMMHIASAQTFIGKDGFEPNRAWTGQSSINRVVLAVLSFVGLIGTALMIVILSMEIIILQIGLVILALLAPIFALVAVHPGMGRRIALTYINTVVELALRRIVLSLMLGVMLAFYAAVMLVSLKTEWIVSIIMMVAVSVGAIMYKGKILDMFSGAVNMGGAGRMNLGDNITDAALGQAKRHGGNASHVAHGAAVGAGTAAVSFGAGAALGAIGRATSGEGSFIGGTRSPRPAARPDSQRENDSTEAAQSSNGTFTDSNRPAAQGGLEDSPAQASQMDSSAASAAAAGQAPLEADAQATRPIPYAMHEAEGQAVAPVGEDDAADAPEVDTRPAPDPEAAQVEDSTSLPVGALPAVAAEEGTETPTRVESQDTRPQGNSEPLTAPEAGTNAAPASAIATGAAAGALGAAGAVSAAPRPTRRVSVPATQHRTHAERLSTPAPAVMKGLPAFQPAAAQGKAPATVRSVKAVMTTPAYGTRQASRPVSGEPVIGATFRIPATPKAEEMRAAVGARKALPKAAAAGKGPAQGAIKGQAAKAQASASRGALPMVPKADAAPAVGPTPEAAPKVAPAQGTAPVAPKATPKAQARPQAAPAANPAPKTAPAPAVAPAPTPAPRMSTKAELRAHAEKLATTQARAEKPSFREAIAKGAKGGATAGWSNRQRATKKGSSAAQGSSSAKRKKGRPSTTLQAAGQGFAAPSRLRKEAQSQNERREREISRLERGLGIAELEARKNRKEDEGR